MYGYLICRCDPNAGDAGERVLACVEATLAEAHALGLPDEMLISYCKARLATSDSLHYATLICPVIILLYSKGTTNAKNSTPVMTFRKSLNTYVSCVLQVVLSADGGAAKWFIQSLQIEEASLFVVRTHSHRD